MLDGVVLLRTFVHQPSGKFFLGHLPFALWCKRGVSSDLACLFTFDEELNHRDYLTSSLYFLRGTLEPPWSKLEQAAGCRR